MGNQPTARAHQMNQPTNPGLAPSEPDTDRDSGKATIGASIKINGDISGKEDLLINGSVEGTVDFRENNVTIGKKGRVSADVVARNISVEGEVKGELRGSEQVTLKPSGHVTGDIRAPRVVLDDGCRFKGSVDMEDKPPVMESRGMAAKLTGTKPFPGRPTPPPGDPPKA